MVLRGGMGWNGCEARRGEERRGEGRAGGLEMEGRRAILAVHVGLWMDVESSSRGSGRGSGGSGGSSSSVIEADGREG